jgi:ribosomal protein S18 acetylase RimI-like enzyme
MKGMPVTGDDATARAYTPRVHPTVTIRPRTADDVPALAGILEAQQPHTGYPVRWPLPFPVERFIVRTTELAGWVATDAGVVVGHVALTDVAPGWEEDGWTAGTGLPASALAAVAVLFVDPGMAGRGVGSALLDTAVARARTLGRTPVLDVVSESTRAVSLYRRHGWQVVGQARPPWLPVHRDPLLLMALSQEAGRSPRHGAGSAAPASLRSTQSGPGGPAAT